ncbi:discoidin domain-containing protein [Paenibacillus sp. DXFW5]|uniref:Discoidin domain-containing protein n=1 Tax=Paenibacillus rhizolycopersici TaxID=2780073 RepID=A0ABS2H3F6_9BACL|nr:discoidin domain-containing protein [Paenibacillus rhizolycopersici]
MRRRLRTGKTTLACILWLAGTLAFSGPLGSAQAVQAEEEAGAYARNGNLVQASNGRHSLVFDLVQGTGSLSWDGLPVVPQFEASFREKGGETRSTRDAVESSAEWTKLKPDAYGKNGRKLTIHSQLETGEQIDLNFYLYPKVSFVLTDMQVQRADGLTVEELTPMDAQRIEIGAGDAKKIFTAPYSNNFDFGVAPVDDFGKSQNGADRFAGEQLTWDDFNGISHWVAAVFDNENKHGFVGGAATVQNWKSSQKLGEAEILNGPLTEFSLYNWGGSHSGTTVSSDLFFLGYYDDYQHGLEEYGTVYNQGEPHMKWDGDVPMGYNTFYSHDRYATAEAMYAMVDYVAEHLKPQGYDYFNLDGGFQAESGLPFEQSITKFIDYVHAKGLKAGGYSTPFTIYEEWLDLPIEGTGLTHRDICLKDEQGNLIKTYLNTYALDLSHPVAQQIVKRNIDDYIRWGYDYIKLDFIDMGMYEGQHYDPSVNGMQNYRIGMGIIRDAVLAADRPIYINESIAPLLPAAFAHGRRAACDTSLGVASYSGIERQAFNTAASWWTNGTIYEYNDPDMIIPQYVIQGFWYKFSQQDAKLLNTAVTLGGGHYLIGDNLPFIDEDRLAWLHNEELLDLLKKGQAAKPLQMTDFYHHEAHSPAVTVLTEGKDNRVVGLSNWTNQAQDIQVELADLGLKPNKKYRLTELYSGRSLGTAQGTLTYPLEAKGSAIIQIVGSGKPAPADPLPMNLALGKPVNVSSTWGDPGYEADRLTDGDPTTRWNAADGQQNDQWAEIDFGMETKMNQVVVKEFRDPYFKTANYTLQYWDGSAYRNITKGFTLGDNRTLKFPEITTTKLRLYLNTNYGVPSIYELEAYYAPGEGGSRIDQDDSDLGYANYSDVRAGIQRMQTFTLEHVDLPKLDVYIYESYRNEVPKDAYYFELVALDDQGQPVEKLFTASLPAYNIPGSISPYSIYPQLKGLDTSKTYGLILKSPGSDYTPSTDNNYGFAYSDADPYAGGEAKLSTDGGLTWFAEANRDLIFTLYTSADWADEGMRTTEESLTETP